MLLRAFAPRFAGTWKPGRLRTDLADGIVATVQAGRFLEGAPASRNRYRVIAREGDRLHVRAEGLATPICLGLNDVLLDVEPAAGTVRYRVQYRLWSQYCYVLSLAIVSPFVIIALLPELPAWLAGQLPEQRQWLLAIAFFWGVIWPAVLTRMHRKPAARALERILERINEEDAP